MPGYMNGKVNRAMSVFRGVTNRLQGFGFRQLLTDRTARFLVGGMLAIAALIGMGFLFVGCRTVSTESTERRDGILIVLGRRALVSRSARIFVSVNGNALRDVSSLGVGESVFIPFSFAQEGWLKISQFPKHELGYKYPEHMYWFPIASSDKGGFWQVQLEQIAHVFKFSRYDPARQRRRLVAKIEPPEFGLVAENQHRDVIKELSIRHPIGDLIARDLSPDSELVYWGVPMSGIEEISVKVKMASGTQEQWQFLGLEYPNTATWWPKRWEVVVFGDNRKEVILRGRKRYP